MIELEHIWGQPIGVTVVREEDDQRVLRETGVVDGFDNPDARAKQPTPRGWPRARFPTRCAICRPSLPLAFFEAGSPCAKDADYFTRLRIIGASSTSTVFPFSVRFKIACLKVSASEKSHKHNSYMGPFGVPHCAPTILP